MPSDPSSSIEVTIDADDWHRIVTAPEQHCLNAAAHALICGAAETGLSWLTQDGVEMSILLTNDATIEQLNAEHRGLAKPTNVLSFPMLDSEELSALRPDGATPILLGDVILAAETIATEAASQAKAPNDHLTHLVIHGVLHLLGYDHECDDEAALMEDLERKILAKMGIADPYAFAGQRQEAG